MDINMEIGILLAYAFGILALYIIGYLFLVPVKLLFKLVFNSIIGGMILLLINWVGSFFGFLIPLNLFSAVCVGALGIPGLLLVYLINLIL
jgi:inhibitor of the pro-sigma K processing machinery